MKKFIFGLVATVMFGFSANAQSQNKTKLFCVTVSCCSVGIFGIDIWHETTCHSVSAGKTLASYSFNTKDDIKEVEVKEDVILAGQYAESGDNLVLPAGKYTVKNSQIEFTPSTAKTKQYCYIREVSGAFFGHEYQYTINICVSFGKNSNTGVVSLTPKLTNDQLAEILKTEDRTIELKENVTIKEDGINYTIKAGKYNINEDGNAYLQNVNFK